MHRSGFHPGVLGGCHSQYLEGSLQQRLLIIQEHTSVSMFWEVFGSVMAHGVLMVVELCVFCCL